MLGLPAVFTIGPRDTPESVTRYATLLTGDSDGTPITPGSRSSPSHSNHVVQLCRGIVEGEMRMIVSTMTMEELFSKRDIFKAAVVKNVQSELEQFGLCIYNANVKELQDTPGNEYFSSLSRKAHEGAINQARIDTAEQRARGEVGEAEKQGKAKQEIAKIKAATAVLETERKGEKAEADARLRTKEINIERELELERINAKRAAEGRDTELQEAVELKRAEMELERLRATQVVKSKIERESAVQKAEADLYRSQKDADGKRYQEEAEAEAKYVKQERETNAVVYLQKQEAEAMLEAKRKEAESRYQGLKADADGLRRDGGCVHGAWRGIRWPPGLDAVHDAEGEYLREAGTRQRKGCKRSAAQDYSLEHGLRGRRHEFGNSRSVPAPTATFWHDK